MGSYRVVKVKAHVLVGAGSGQLCQVGQGAHSCAIELVDAQIVEVLIAQRGLAGQHLAQHHYLRIRQGLYHEDCLGHGLCKRRRCWVKRSWLVQKQALLGQIDFQCSCSHTDNCRREDQISRQYQSCVTDLRGWPAVLHHHTD